VLPHTFTIMASDEKAAAADMAKGSNEGSDTESLRGPVDPLTGERKLVRQLKNRHIAMIR
jgi:amino acid transporter